MEKMPHESFRDMARDAATEVWRDMCNRWADEIEHAYIPIPVDEDGRKWEIGDACIAYGDETYVCGYGKYGGVFVFDEGKSVFNAIDSKNLDRIAPKVVDVDQIEINIGDTVFGISREVEYEVVGISKTGLVIAKSITGPVVGENIIFHGKELTHEKPVFDADGVRICGGDTVWNVKNARKFKVISLDSVNTRVHVRKENGFMEYISPRYLTHHEPDSLEKLREDMEKYKEQTLFSERKTEGTFDEFLDRITALIEREA